MPSNSQDGITHRRRVTSIRRLRDYFRNTESWDIVAKVIDRQYVLAAAEFHQPLVQEALRYFGIRTPIHDTEDQIAADKARIEADELRIQQLQHDHERIANQFEQAKQQRVQAEEAVARLAERETISRRMEAAIADRDSVAAQQIQAELTAFDRRRAKPKPRGRNGRSNGNR